MSNRLLLDDTGKDIVRAINALGATLTKSGTIYGFHIDAVESSPDAKVTYIENNVGFESAYYDFENDVFVWGSWKDAFFLPRPCMVGYDGVVDYYLDPDDYTKKADGSASDIANVDYAGNAMMEWGQNGRKIWMSIIPSSDGKSADVRIADNQIDESFHAWSFYNSNGEMVDHFYTGIYNGCEVTGTDGVARLRSISGQMPCHNKTYAQEETLAKANNPDSDVMWYCEVWSDVMLINMLLVLISKSTNTQAKFGNGWMKYDASHPTGSGYYGITPSGAANNKGMFYGDASGNVPVKVFGMENWWANIWRRVAGAIVDYGDWKVKYTWGTQDGSAVEGYNQTGNGYISLGAPMMKHGTVSAEGQGSVGNYLKSMYFSKTGSAVPCESGDGASSSTYYTDYCYYNVDVSARLPFRGGALSSGAYCGSFYLASNHAGSYTYWYVGAGVSLKPLV